MPTTQRPGESLAEFRARRRDVQRRSDAKHREARRAWKRAHSAKRRREHPEIVAAEARRNRERHRAERAAESNAYYHSHRDEVLAKQAARLAGDPALAERRRATQRRYYAQHCDTLRAKVTAWRKANQERKNLSERIREGRRRAQTRGAADVRLTRAEWLEIKAGQLGLCVYCFRRRHLTLDHITAISRGGAHAASNVAGACADCNHRKHNTTLIVWLARMAKERGA